MMVLNCLIIDFVFEWGTYHIMCMFLCLQAPVGKVYFTGEHTHPELFGYADGAYFAGNYII